MVPQPKAPTKELLSYFDGMHRDVLGVPAVIQWGKDSKLIAALWKSHGEDMVMNLMSDFFGSDDEFVQSAGYTVGVFISQAGKLLARRQIALRQKAVREHWRDECSRIHGGACHNAPWHQAKKAQAS